jgi:hypothetical protein
MADDQRISLSMEHIDAKDPPELIALIERLLKDLTPADRLDYYDYIDPEMIMHTAGDTELAGEGLVLDLYASARIVAKRAIKHLQAGGILEEVIALHGGQLTLSEKLIQAHDMRFGDFAEPLVDEDERKFNAMPLTPDERAIDILVTVQSNEEYDERLRAKINPALSAAAEDPRVVEELFLRAAAVAVRREAGEGKLSMEQIVEIMEQALPNVTLGNPQDDRLNSTWVSR